MVSDTLIEQVTRDVSTLARYTGFLEGLIEGLSLQAQQLHDQMAGVVEGPVQIDGMREFLRKAAGAKQHMEEYLGPKGRPPTPPEQGRKVA